MSSPLRWNERNFIGVPHGATSRSEARRSAVHSRCHLSRYGYRDRRRKPKRGLIWIKLSGFGGIGNSRTLMSRPELSCSTDIITGSGKSFCCLRLPSTLMHDRSRDRQQCPDRARPDHRTRSLAWRSICSQYRGSPDMSQQTFRGLVAALLLLFANLITSVACGRSGRVTPSSRKRSGRCRCHFRCSPTSCGRSATGLSRS